MRTYVTTIQLFCFLLSVEQCFGQVDLIHHPGTMNSLELCSHTGTGACMGTIAEVIDQKVDSGVMVTSIGTHEGHVDITRIVSESDFKRNVDLSFVSVDYYALGLANGATEYAREVGLHLNVEVKRDQTWISIAEHPGGCSNNPNADTVCTIGGPLTLNEFGDEGKDVTGLKVSVVASALRVGGAGFSRTEAKLIEVQALGFLKGIILPGDYNNNDAVDAADYVLWRNGGPLQNDPTPDVQPADYDVWRENFGTSGSTNFANTIPEPATWMILSGALLRMIRRRI